MVTLDKTPIGRIEMFVNIRNGKLSYSDLSDDLKKMGRDYTRNEICSATLFISYE